jgi:hypothetical protein
VLRDDHPLRRLVSRVGLAVARHALTTIAIAVSVGMCLSIPVFPLRVRTLPLDCPIASSHAWTSLQSLSARDSLIPDISIKQLWVYGDGAGALERDVILEAASIQEALLGPESHWATATWRTDTGGSLASAEAFIHSPLLYWNGSSGVGSTESIVAMVNSRIGDKSLANVTLTPTSVFSGAAWSNGRIVMADALIISLFYKNGSRAGKRWDDRAITLGHAAEGKWEASFHDAAGSRSELFRFESRPVNLRDDAIFFTAYTVVSLLVARGFKDLKLLRSKAVLLAAMALQVRIMMDDWMRRFLTLFTGSLFGLLQLYRRLVSPHGCF